VSLTVIILCIFKHWTGFKVEFSFPWICFNKFVPH